MTSRWSEVRLVIVAVLGAAVWAAGARGTVHAAGSHDAPEHEALEHAHGPRHGGQFGDADDLYHYEVLLEAPDRLIVYVNDELNRPLNVRSLTGRWTVNPDDAHPDTGELTPSTDGAYFTARLSSTVDPVHLEVAVLNDDQWAALEFVLPLPSVSAKRP